VFVRVLQTTEMAGYTLRCSIIRINSRPSGCTKSCYLAWIACADPHSAVSMVRSEPGTFWSQVLCCSHWDANYHCKAR